MPTGSARIRAISATSCAASRSSTPAAIAVTLPRICVCSRGLHDNPDEAPLSNGDGYLPDAWFAGAFGSVLVRIEGSALPAYVRSSDAAARDAHCSPGLENLGETCDFSIAQDHFNAHPVGLLRWAATTIPRVIAGLRCGFHGIGDAPHGGLVWDEEHSEYKLFDMRYLVAHTWVLKQIEDPVERAERRRATQARLRLLARKLMADLRSGRRICVLAPHRGVLPMDKVRELHAVLRGIGPNALLAVGRRAAPAEVGRVDVCGGGLFIGHTDRFARDDGGAEIWHRLCTATRGMVDEQAAAQRRAG